MKIDNRAPVAAPSLSGIPDLIAELDAAERAGADPRRIGQLEGVVASTPCESVGDAAAKAELLVALLDRRPDATIEGELARTVLEYLKAAR